MFIKKWYRSPKASVSIFTRLFPLTFASVFSLTIVQAQAVDKSLLDEIIVTAEKREASLQDTPISIAAFNENALESLGVEEAGDIAEFVPNLSIRKQPSSDDNFGFAIRGVAAGETALFTEPTVGLYIDGVYIGRQTGSAFELNDLERIEVLRGPQGALYGRNTIGGAINLITKKPSGESGFRQKISYGNRDFWRSLTSLDFDAIDIGDSRLATSLSYLRSEHGGTLRNSVDGSDLGRRDSEGLRFAAQLQVNDALVADYILNISDKDSYPEISQISAVRPSHSGVGGAIIQQAAAEASATRIGAISRAFATADRRGASSEIQSHGLTLTYQGDITIKSITSYREWDSSTDTTDFGSYLSDGATVNSFAFNPTFTQLIFTPIPAGEAVSLFRAERESRQNQFTQEFQFIGDAMDEALDYVLGAFYFKEKVYEDNPQNFTLPIVYSGLTSALSGGDPAIAAGLLSQACNGVAFDFLTAAAEPTVNGLPLSCLGQDVALGSPVFVYGGTVESYALYGQFTYHVDDALDVTLGLRYTYDDKEAFLFNTQIGGGQQKVAANEDWSNFNPSLTLSYQWAEDLTTYFTAATGYRSGGFNPRATNQASFQTPFDKEGITSFELGWKSEWLDNRLRVNGAIFYLDYTDRQVAQFEAGSGGASTKIVNAGEQAVDGFELDIVAVPYNGVTAMLSYGYNHAVFKKFVTGLQDPVTGFPVQDAGGAVVADATTDPRAGTLTVPFSPLHTGSLILRWELPAFDFGQLALQASATYSQDVAYHPILNLFDTTDEYTLYNARASLSEVEFGSGKLRVDAWGNNITGEEVRGWGIDFGALGFAVNSYNELESYGVDVVFEF